MPNWVFNSLTIQGPKEQVDGIKERLNSPFSEQHDRWNMETQQMEISETTYSNPVFAFHNIYNHKQDGVSDEAYIQQPARAEVDSNHPDWWKKTMELANVDNSWYSWNNRNWGTKWDVAVSDDNEYPDTELLEHVSNGEDQWVVYKFQTAWSPPMPAIEKLSALVPNCVVTLSYEEEQGWGGETEFVNGNMTAHSEYESKCRDCDSDNTMEYCENDCGEICSECHYMGEADLECVADCEEHKQYLTPEFVPDYRLDQINV